MNVRESDYSQLQPCLESLTKERKFSGMEEKKKKGLFQDRLVVSVIEMRWLNLVDVCYTDAPSNDFLLSCI